MTGQEKKKVAKRVKDLSMWQPFERDAELPEFDQTACPMCQETMDEVADNLCPVWSKYYKKVVCRSCHDSHELNHTRDHRV